MKEIKVSTHLIKILELHSDLCRTAGSTESELMEIFKQQDPPRSVGSLLLTDINEKMLFLELIEKRMAIIQKEYIDTHERECAAFEYAEEIFNRGFYTICVVDDDFDEEDDES